MRNILILCGLIAIVGIVWLVISLRAPNHYGAAFTGAPRTEVVALIDRPTEFLGKQVTIEGKVADQCPTTGCFFYFYVGTKKLKIELGDIAQTLPKKPGVAVTVEGQLVPLGDSYQFLGTAVEFH